MKPEIKPESSCYAQLKSPTPLDNNIPMFVSCDQQSVSGLTRHTTCTTSTNYFFFGKCIPVYPCPALTTDAAPNIPRDGNLLPSCITDFCPVAPTISDSTDEFVLKW